ncbi:garnet [Carabus blaptoides fortunei]
MRYTKYISQCMEDIKLELRQDNVSFKPRTHTSVSVTWLLVNHSTVIRVTDGNHEYDTSTKSYIRTKAVLMMYKVFLKFPEALRSAFPRLKEKLEDPDPGVQLPAINVVACNILGQSMDMSEGVTLSDSASSHGATDDPHRALNIDLDTPLDQETPSALKKAVKTEKTKKLQGMKVKRVMRDKDKEREGKKSKKSKAGYEEAAGISTPMNLDFHSNTWILSAGRVATATATVTAITDNVSVTLHES